MLQVKGCHIMFCLLFSKWCPIDLGHTFLLYSCSIVKNTILQHFTSHGHVKWHLWFWLHYSDYIPTSLYIWPVCVGLFVARQRQMNGIAASAAAALNHIRMHHPPAQLLTTKHSWPTMTENSRLPLYANLQRVCLRGRLTPMLCLGWDDKFKTFT